MYERRGHLLGVHQRLVGGDIEMQICLMDTTKHPQIHAQRRTCPFACVAMHLPLPVTIVIARPFTGAVTDGPMRRMAPRIAVGLVGIQHGAPNRNILVDQRVAGLLIGMLADPKAMFAALARDQMNDRWPVVRIGAAATLVIGAPAWRIGQVAMGRTFSPPRSDRVHRPQRLSPASDRSARSRSGSFGPAGAAYASACVTI